MNVKIFNIYPEVAFHTSIFAMDVYGFISFICVEKQPPSEKNQYGWHVLNFSICKHST
ncbi:hypothetical protein BN874_1260014 [Candidatus Contendobacter odensis Run_B_J11]|uniref:Uncharacterized protein n=1 Tax=Candidatus Contendobacter odensis Run_B_J11 TaxID=1400861 RepID=A0A7U7G8T8_9GAMM|nr:hypothetical protein BN874_1260014 [Candidatus Contendobacter odensis Run_B_J11]